MKSNLVYSLWFIVYSLWFMACNLWLAVCFAYPPTKEAKPVFIKELSITEVTKIALEENLDIQIAKFDAYINRLDYDRANGIFDTFLNLEASFYDNQKKSSSTFSGTKSIEESYGVSLEKKLPTGTDIKIETSQKRNWTNSSFSSVNPAYEAVAKVILTQPIGKNFFGLIDRSRIKITKLDIENSDWTSLDSIEESLASAQKAYWKLVLKEEELTIQQNMLKEAKDFYHIYTEKFKLGLAEEPDVYASQANLKLKEFDVSLAQLQRQTAKNDLLFVLNEEDTGIEIKPKDILDIFTQRVDIYTSLSGAVGNRRDYKVASNQVLSQKIDLVLKGNSLWPQIDLEASFAKNGLSNDYKTSWEGITGEDNPEVFLGITVRLPLENSEAKSDYRKAELIKEKYILNLKRTERLIFKELNNQVASLNSLSQRVRVYQEVVKLQEKKLKAEKKQFKSGRSSSDLIIRYENDLLGARLSLARSLFDYRLSLIDLDLAKNTLLSKYWQDEL